MFGIQVILHDILCYWCSARNTLWNWDRTEWYAVKRFHFFLRYSLRYCSMFSSICNGKCLLQFLIYGVGMVYGSTFGSWERVWERKSKGVREKKLYKTSNQWISMENVSRHFCLANKYESRKRTLANGQTHRKENITYFSWIGKWYVWNVCAWGFSYLNGKPMLDLLYYLYMLYDVGAIQ